MPMAVFVTSHCDHLGLWLDRKRFSLLAETSSSLSHMFCSGVLLREGQSLRDKQRAIRTWDMAQMHASVIKMWSSIKMIDCRDSHEHRGQGFV